jgi:hypothetical protein
MSLHFLLLPVYSRIYWTTNASIFALSLKSNIPSFLRPTIKVPALYNFAEVFNIENKKFRARSRRLPDAVSHVIQIIILKHHQHSLHIQLTMTQAKAHTDEQTSKRESHQLHSPNQTEMEADS